MNHEQQAVNEAYTPTSFVELWSEFQGEVLPPDADENARLETQKAFVAGALAFRVCQQRATQTGDDAETKAANLESLDVSLLILTEDCDRREDEARARFEEEKRQLAALAVATLAARSGLTEADAHTLVRHVIDFIAERHKPADDEAARAETETAE